MCCKRFSIAFFLLIILQSFVTSVPIEEIRSHFEKGSESMEYAEKLKSLTSNKKTPLHKAYYGMSYALMAKHSNGPFKKLELVKKGMDFINTAVKEEPNNIEIRFLRFSIESKAPSFLGISEHLEEDKLKLLNGLNASHSYFKVIHTFLIQSSYLTNKEKDKLKALK
jgi:hypothetical protein